MVTAGFDEALTVGRIVLRPNRSWTWRANTCLIATLTVVSALIAGGFALRGMWMVLPFSTIEMSALLACLYYCVRRTHRQEVLTFSAEELVVEQGHRRPERTVRFERFWTRVLVEPARHEQPVDPGQQLLGGLGPEPLRVDPDHLHPAVMSNAGVVEPFHRRGHRPRLDDGGDGVSGIMGRAEAAHQAAGYRSDRTQRHGGLGEDP